MKDLPKPFKEQMQNALNDYKSFEAALQLGTPTSIRYNSQKSIVKQQSLEPVSWSSNGFYLAERPVFTLDPLFHAGAYYVQEASSMFVGEALRQLVSGNRPLRALDLCAAPGGKSTLLSSVLPKGSFLLCNEVIKSRVSVLQQNMYKWGNPNVAISNHDSRDFKGLKNFFDVILVDAPCSGEGLFRKDKKAIAEWSADNVALCSARQRRILEEAIPLLKDGGLFLYSTCTYNAKENENQAAFLTSFYDLEALDLDIPNDWNIEKRSIGFQFYPHRVKGEGFYLACFRKKMGESSLRPSIMRVTNFSMKKLPKKQVPLVEPYLEYPKLFQYFIKANQQIVAIPHHLVDVCMQVDQQLQRKGFGIELGQFKREQFIPSHQLALSTAISKSLPSLELTKEQALRYLKKETFEIKDASQGWTLAQYEGLNLGWLKVLKNRMNNYFPKEWRIRMSL